MPGRQHLWGYCASIPHPWPTPLSPKGVAHLFEWLMCKCALVEHGAIGHGKGHSSQGNFPVRPKRLGLFFCSPLLLGITRKKRLQAFPFCLPRTGGSCRNDAPGIHVVQGQHRSMATKVPDFVHVGCLEHSTGAAPTLWSQHCFLATEELSSWATCSLSGRNQMNEVTKDMGKHEESIFLGL